jgi:hypothetical protein
VLPDPAPLPTSCQEGCPLPCLPAESPLCQPSLAEILLGICPGHNEQNLPFFFLILAVFSAKSRGPWVSGFLGCCLQDPVWFLVSLCISHKTRNLSSRNRHWDWINAFAFFSLISWNKFRKILSIIVKFTKSQTHWASSRWGKLLHIPSRGNEQDWGRMCAWCESCFDSWCRTSATFWGSYQLKQAVRTLWARQLWEREQEAGDPGRE